MEQYKQLRLQDFECPFYTDERFFIFFQCKYLSIKNQHFIIMLYEDALTDIGLQIINSTLKIDFFFHSPDRKMQIED